MHQITWARWVEIAGEHEASARAAYERIVAGDVGRLTAELRESLIAISAAAVTVEALYEDIRYLIVHRPTLRYADARVADGLAAAFGLPPERREALGADVAWLFARRNEAVHGYAEPEAPQRHPAGFATGAEAARFNAVESRRALLVALRVLGDAAAPAAPAGRWVRRWVAEREPYQVRVVQPIRDRLPRDPSCALSPPAPGS